MVDDELGAGLGYHAKLFGIGSAVGHVNYHLGVPITREAAILHSVDAPAAELNQRRGPLRISFLKPPGYLLDG